MTLPTMGSRIYYQLYIDPSFSSLGLYLPNLDLHSPLWEMALTYPASVSLTVTNIPATASAIAAGVDGAGLSTPLEASQNVALGSGSVTMSFGVPAGGPYRVRVIAATSTGYPNGILSTGLSSGVTVTAGAPTVASVRLDSVSASLDPSTPVSAAAGSVAQIKINISDPGEILTAREYGCYVFSATTPFTSNARASAKSGTLTKIGTGSYSCAVSMTLPTMGSRIYYQLYIDPSFSSLGLYLPNLDLHSPLWEMALTYPASVSLTVTNIPATASAIAAGVDGAGLSTPLEASQNVALGSGSVTMSFGVPAGGPYRVRVIAATSTGYPNGILSTGLSSGVTVTAGAPTVASVRLDSVSASLDPSTPVSAAAGSVAQIKINISDPGEILTAREYGCYVFSAATPFTSNAGASAKSGTLTKIGTGSYSCAVSMTLPTMGSRIYYQLYIDPSFSSLGLYLPNLDLHSPLWEMALTGGPPTMNVAPSLLNFAYQGGGIVPQSQAITLSASSATAFTAATTGGNWLSVSPSSGTTPSSLSVSVNPVGLLAGTYTGTATITAPGASNSPQTVNVTLVITQPPALAVAPSSLSFIGAGSQTLAISNTGGGTLNWTAAANQAWLTVAPLSGTSAGSISVTVHVTGLAPGTYNGAVTITATGATGSPATIPVTLNIAQPPVLAVTPSSLTFTGAGSQNLAISNTGGGALNWTAVVNQAWLTVAPLSGTGAGTISVTVNVTGLAPGTYNGAITITATGAAESPATIPVTLNIAQPPVLAVTPSSLTFTGAGSQNLAISNTGGGTLNWSAAVNQAWLTVAPLSGTGAASVSVTVNVTGLAPGTYNGAVTITATGATGSPATIPVTLNIAQRPVLAVAPSSLTFTGAGLQTLTISNTGGGTLNWTAAANQAWLTVAPLSGSGAGSVSVTSNVTGLAPGTYNGTITITATGSSNSPQTVGVTLTVAAPSPSFVISPATLSFSVPGGATSAIPKQLDVNSSGAPITFIVSAASTGNWLTVIGTTPIGNGAWQAITPKSVGVFVDPTHLTQGSYSGTITITSVGAQNSPQTVAVTLSVGAPPSVSASPSSLAFTANTSDAASQTRSIALSISDPSAMLSFTAAASGGSWLSVNSGRGYFPGNVNVAVNPTGLAIGTYSASVIMSVVGASNSPLTLPVTLTVSASAQPITVTTTPAVLQISVDGSFPATAPQTYAWIPGSTHTIAVTSPQSDGIRYTFESWSDGGTASHTVTTPAGPATYTANFTAKYLLGKYANPGGSGSIVANPTSDDGYYTPGTTVQLTATPAAGYVFSSFSGDLTGTSNPQSITLNAPRFVTANFKSIVETIVDTVPSGLALVVDGETTITPRSYPWQIGSTHTIAASSPQGTGTRYVFSDWSDAGAVSHTVTAQADLATYTANFTKQYLLTTATNPGGGSVTPFPTSTDGYYNSGTNVYLTAIPPAGKTFAFFSGDMAGSTNPQSISMTAPRSVTANFSSGTGGNVPPYAVDLSPFQGAGVTQTFTGTFTDANGWTDIAKAAFRFHESYAGTAGACIVEIRPQSGQITLLDDSGVSYLTPVALGSTTPLQNNACSVDAAYSGFSGSGNVLTANVALTFKPAFGSAGGREPRKAICQWAKDTAGAGEDQSCLGMWLPEAPAPVKIPRYRLYNPANYAHFFTASQNERDVLVTRGFTPEDPPPGMAYNQPATISGISTHPFYRILFFPQNGAPIFHYWTRDREEYKAAVRIRNLNLGEGMDSFLLSGQAPGTYPTYRMRFTAGPTAYPIYHYALQAEHDALLGFGWGVSLGVDGYLQPMPAPLAQVTAGLQTPPRKVIAAVLSAASHESGPVAPGQLIRVYGSNFSKLAQAFIDGNAVRLTAVTERYIELAIPETVAGRESIALFVDDLGVRTEAFTVPVTAANPAVFVKDFLGRGIVETLPSDAGTITLQVTGAGELDLGQPKLPLTVRLNGYPSEIISISTIADQPGRLAVNVKLPAEVLAAGTDLATVSLQAGEANAQPGLLARVK